MAGPILGGLEAMTVWDKSQVRVFVRRVQGEVGVAWPLIGERFQRALLAEGALTVLRGQAREEVKVEAMDWLLTAMLLEAGLDPEG